MPCVFHAERPDPFHDLDPGCQFSVVDDALLIVDEQSWCPYHCPMIDKEGNPTEKSTWDQTQLQAFHDKLKHRLTTALTESRALDFTGVVFPQKVRYPTLPSVSFYRAIFSGDAKFENATFKGSTTFKEAIFKEDASFYGAAFDRDAVFYDTHFKGDAAFDHTTFIDFTQFRISTFHENATFNNAIFGNFASFQNATFIGTAEFVATTFSSSVNFQEATFEEPALFQSSANANEEQNSRAKVFYSLDCTAARFKSSVSFVNRQFLQPAVFAGCTFAKAPEFHGCSIHQGTVFPPRQNFKDVTSKRAAQAYRTLKLAMEQVRARQEEAMFFALEEESRIYQPDTPFREKFASNMYGALSVFGTNFMRPLWWLLGITVASFLLYASLTYCPSIVLNYGQECLYFTIEQLVRPFSAWLPTGRATLKRIIGDDFCLLIIIQLLATLQSLASLTLITLFILSLRRRFKLS